MYLGDLSIGAHHSFGTRSRQQVFCEHCGGRVLVFIGYWGTFVPVANGSYPVADAMSLHNREAVAVRRAVEDPRDLVVRWVDREELS
jgi:hypothetical protein